MKFTGFIQVIRVSELTILIGFIQVIRVSELTILIGFIQVIRVSELNIVIGFIQVTRVSELKIVFGFVQVIHGSELTIVIGLYTCLCLDGVVVWCWTVTRVVMVRFSVNASRISLVRYTPNNTLFMSDKSPIKLELHLYK